MDEVCELLSDIPASKISSLFGLSAGHVQKKLAVRCVWQVLLAGLMAV